MKSRLDHAIGHELSDVLYRHTGDDAGSRFAFALDNQRTAGFVGTD